LPKQSRISAVSLTVRPPNKQKLKGKLHSKLKKRIKLEQRRMKSFTTL